ncbi:helix-turn-helix transcriptional regulator [Rhizobium sp. BT-226]|uniref:helix-turn-helix domain-containing protein n=1 Tax=Rhizobium sp. BT-226 TaxID=2986922 RepID=UPI0021F71565|nr:helix-turn-helix transcriptional regulator [Rhizobium sp. BT-226]MCW0014894.1 helix-turn-helix domain-containing protein [Rhizobium sp. BT-226]
MFDLKAFRASLDLTQHQMAEAMGMPFRSYQDIESGKSPVRPVHEAAAKYAGWLIRQQGRHKGARPLHFFLARFRDDERTWTVPWTVWAEDFSDAVERFYTLASIDRSQELQIRVMPEDASKSFHHAKKHAEAVLEHKDATWPE